MVEPSGVQDVAQVELIDVTRLNDSDLLFSAEERTSGVFGIVKNPQGGPVAGYPVWVDNGEKYSPDVGFHAVKQFHTRKPIELIVSEGGSPMFHNDKNAYVLVAVSHQPRTQIPYKLNKGREYIHIEPGHMAV